MNYKYPNVSAGYVGNRKQRATLNSAFFAELLNSNSGFTLPLIYPQRIPRISFFEEIKALEDANFKSDFDKFVDHIKNRLTSLNHGQSKKNTSQIEMLNLLNLLLRYGQCQSLTQMDFNNTFEDEYSFIYRLILENAKIEECLCFDRTIDFNSLIKLNEEILSQSSISETTKIYALNRLVVVFCRHGKKINNKVPIQNYVMKLTTLLENYQHKNDFKNMLLISMVYRGVAMYKELGEDKQNQFLNNAEILARGIKSITVMEELLIKDNLYTLLQTLSKWNYHKGNKDLAEKNLAEMIEINPEESTGYSELGFFLINIDDWKGAHRAFQKAIFLGPPAVGMNLYYYAQCLREQGDINAAVTVLKQVNEIDPKAISPLLDLMEHFLNNDQPQEAKSIAKRIYHEATLKEQLDELEIKQLEELLYS